MMRSNPSIPIPRTVPLLPLHDKVLLPGVVTRLQISRRESIPLFEKILRSYDSKDLNKCIIGVFLVHTPLLPLSDSASSNENTKDNSDNGDNGVNNNNKGNSNIRKKRSSSISKSDYGGYPLTDDGAVVGSNAGQVVPSMGGGGPASGNGGRGGSHPPVDPAHIHATGCAARLVRLERAVGGFTVMLEGECVSFDFWR
jgi:ATP-dependent Lon protease